MANFGRGLQRKRTLLLATSSKSEEKEQLLQSANPSDEIPEAMAGEEGAVGRLTHLL